MPISGSACLTRRGLPMILTVPGFGPKTALPWTVKDLKASQSKLPARRIAGRGLPEPTAYQERCSCWPTGVGCAWVAAGSRESLWLVAYAWPGLGELTRDLWVRLKGPDGLSRNLLEVCCSSPDAVSPEVVDAARRLARERPHDDEVHAFLAAYRSTWTYLLNGRRFDSLLRAVQAPALVIHGGRDRLVPPLVSRRVARVRPDWTHLEFEHAGHMPQLDEPDRFVAALEGWLDGLEERHQAAI